MPTWRRAHALRHATPADIGRFVRWDIDWSRGDFLEILACRVESLAQEQPLEGYSLALDGLLVLARRAGAADYVGQAYMAAGAAARRMGRSSEAATLYGNAEEYVRTARSRGRLLLSKATLALYDRRFGDAESFVASSKHLLAADDEDLALMHIVRANVRAEKFYVESLRTARREVEIAFPNFRTTIRGGPREVIDTVLSDYSEAIELAGNGSDHQAVALFNMLAFKDLVGGPDAIERRLPALCDLRQRMKKLRSRGSHRTWAYIDWIEGVLAYRRGVPKAGRRLLIRAGNRFKRNKIFACALRVAVDLVEFENAREDALNLVAFGSQEFRNVRSFFEQGATVEILRQEVDRAAAGKY